MNELQKAQFQILKTFVEICDKLNLKYYLVCGSALGAVKYKGFIPWDDDVDVGMFRKDYEAFLQEAPKYLPTNYFLQNYSTESNFPFIFSKLRNSETTFIEKTCKNIPMNHGVYIDIFPLDGYPQGKLRQKLFELRKTHYKRNLACVFEVDRGFVSGILCKVNRLLGKHKHTLKTCQKYNKMITKYPVENSEIICNHGNWQGVLEYAPKEQYGDGQVLAFEGLPVRVPEKYDEYLRQKYGDYTQDLPTEEQQGHHYYSVLDLENPYTRYLNR